MALITLSALLSDVKGKIGGGVFQNSQGGLMLRTKVSPINRRTSTQVTSRLKMFNLQNDWIRLTTAQRADWELFAQTYPRPQLKNPLCNINGHQYFLKYNDYRVRYGLAVLNDVSWTVPSFSSVIGNLMNDGSDLFLFTSRKLDFVNEFVVLFLSWQVSKGMNNPSNRRKMIIGSTLTGNLLTITDSYLNVFGELPAVGSEVFLKLAVFSRNTAYWTAFYESKVTVEQIYAVGTAEVGTTFVVR